MALEPETPPTEAQEPVAAVISEPVTNADPTKGYKVEDVTLVIDGLPVNGLALHWAVEMFRKTKQTIRVIGTLNGETVCTIDAAYVARVKAAKAAAPKKAKTSSGEPKAEKTQPDGKRLAVVNLAMRPQGASTAELVAATGWKGAPWRWSFSNKHGTGLADRYGYDFRTETVDGTVRYFLSRPTQTAAAA